MRLSAFQIDAPGRLVPVTGRHPRFGEWNHAAFVPEPLENGTPAVDVRTFNAVARARAALAALDTAAAQLPNRALLRRPTLRREAQSTSALEGTYAPLEDVLAADDDVVPPRSALREVLNYVRTAEHAFRWLRDDRPLTVPLLADLQGQLVMGTSAETGESGRIRQLQVVIGSHPGARIQDARFVPHPPGDELERQVRDLMAWITTGHDDIDPVVAAGMAHYQFETLHPFHDGNGRLGRLLVVLHLMTAGVLTEPNLTVSPWFEARRAEYYDRLLAVSTHGAWDAWLSFFAEGLAASAKATHAQLLELLVVQSELKTRVRAAGLRAERAMQLVDFAFEQTVFTVRQVQKRLGVAYPRANELVAQLVNADVLRPYDDAVYARRFTAPEVLAVLLR